MKGDPSSETARCYVCKKIKPMDQLGSLGNGTYQCIKKNGKPYHKLSTKQKVWDERKEERGRKFLITIPQITITVEEV